MNDKLLNVPENAPHPITRGDGIVDGDIVGYRVKIVEGWLGPDYFSHRAKRFFATRDPLEDTQELLLALIGFHVHEVGRGEAVLSDENRGAVGLERGEQFGRFAL